MKLRHHTGFIFFFLIFPIVVLAQNHSRVKGKIFASDGLPLSDASIQTMPDNHFYPIQKDGSFDISLAKTSEFILINFLGYQEKIIRLDTLQSSDINIYMTQSTVNLDVDILVTAQRKDKNISSTSTGAVEMNIEELKSLPILFGEVDPLKSLTLTPGVQASSEGSTGLIVRGGDPGQNLILYDNTQLFNPSHLAGFFSVFNPDAVYNVKLIKSGIPAEYGGRISSVIDVMSDDGNSDSLIIKGGIGIVASKININGPFNNKKGKFSISARRTYFDLMEPLLSSFLPPKSLQRRIIDYYFYDFNFKGSYMVTPKDKISLSGYLGRDFYNYNLADDDVNKIDWGNKMGNITWNHIFNPNFSFENTTYISDYQFDMDIKQPIFAFSLKSGATDIGNKSKLTYYGLTNHKISIGGEYIFHNFSPTRLGANIAGAELEFQNLSNLYSSEIPFFIHDEYQVTNRLTLNAGVRFTYYQHIGPFFDYTKNAVGQITDTVQYDKGTNIKDFWVFEPRFSLRYMITTHSSVKASATKNYQFIHLATVPSASMPTDIWLPSTSFIDPAYAYQYSLGYYHNFDNNTFETSIEAYYKDMYNLVEFKNGVLNSAFNQELFEDIAQGRGEAYGIEIFLRKIKGDITGWIGYTLSKTTRTFEEINNGEPFPYTYDRRHDFSTVLSYQLTPKFRVGATFVFATGNAITMPKSIYIIQQTLISEYGSRNSFRMPPYHRLDLSVTYTTRPRNKYESSWSLSIYNVYNRANPYYIYFDIKGSVEDYNIDIKAKQVSLFPIIPAISWNFKF